MAPSLRAKKVAVVGVGAVGSYVVDLLIRRGLSELTIVDGEDMRPGNSIRHLLADGACELTGKVEGVAKVVENYRFAPDLNIQPVHGHLRSVENARLLLESHDVVVDATASGEASALLADAASTEHPVVSVALQREGGVIRIDRYPASSRHPEVPVIETSRPIRVEAGCVDPVSPTTPDQVVEAAAWATRMTIDVLLKGSQFDSSIVIVTREQPDPPYDRLGFVSQEAAGQR